MSQKYLVTGGEGFIGSKIVKATDGVSFDIKSNFDILDKEKLQKMVTGKVGIFHCAAKISVPESFEIAEEYHRTNVDGTQSIIGAAKISHSKIVFSSSAAVYGESDKAISESFELHPKSPYAENKRDAEKILKDSGVPCICLRYFNVYGPGQSAEYAGVISKFIKNALDGKDLIIAGDGEQVRDFVFIDDIAEANVAAMHYNKRAFDIFNIASGTPTTIKDLAEMIIKLTNSKSKIKFEAARPGDIVFSLADISKANNQLGWMAKVSLEQGLKKTIESFLK